MVNDFYRFSRKLFRHLLHANGNSNYIELISPLLSLDSCYARITKIDHLDKDTVMLTLKPNRKWRGNKAGQFIGLGVVVNGKRLMRYYSPLSNNYGESSVSREITIVVSRHPGGLVSNYLNDQARPGMIVSVSPASGDFILPEVLPDKLRFFSAGSGFTPIVSMLNELIKRHYQGSVLIAHYVPTEEKIACKKLFANLAAQLDHAELIFGLTQVGAETEIQCVEHNYVLGRICQEHLQDFTDPTITTYVAGPIGFVTSISQITDRLSFHQEVFTPILAIQPHTEEEIYPVHINCTKRKIDVPADNHTTVLDALLAADVPVKYGCKMGICYTCTRVKKIGTVRNILTNTIDEDPGTHIQLCINTPETDLEIEA